MLPKAPAGAKKRHRFSGQFVGPNVPAHDQAVGFGLLCVMMRFRPETTFEHYGERCLRQDKLLHLQKKYPASDFKSASERAQAIINEIETMLLPAIDKADAAGTLSMIESAMTFSGDLFDRELALDERLNAMIDRAIKRLIQIKAMKQMLNQVPNRPKSEVLKLRAPNT